MLEIKLSTIEYIITLTLIVSASIQLFYYLFFYLRVSFVKRKTPQAQKENPLSVIICAKNEEDNLKEYLEKVLQQKYSVFEVIVIDDCSADNTEIYLQEMQKKYSNLRYSSIKEDPKFKHNKKLAVTIGIKAAKYDHFVFIDADCYPDSELWLQSINNEFALNKSIILGYGGYIPEEGFLDKLVRYDTFSIGVQYLAFAHAGLPYMAVGRNMAYTRSTYEQSSKFSKHYHIRSGDDDLFIEEVGTRTNTGIALDKNSFTRSKQVKSYKEWKTQKLRHLSTSGRYKLSHKILLVLEPLSRLLFYVLTLVYLFGGYNDFYIIVISLIGTRFAVQLIVNYFCAARLNERKLPLHSLLFDITLPIILFVLHIKVRLQKKR